MFFFIWTLVTSKKSNEKKRKQNQRDSVKLGKKKKMASPCRDAFSFLFLAPYEFVPTLIADKAETEEVEISLSLSLFLFIFVPPMEIYRFDIKLSRRRVGRDSQTRQLGLSFISSNAGFYFHLFFQYLFLFSSLLFFFCLQPSLSRTDSLIYFGPHTQHTPAIFILSFNLFLKFILVSQRKLGFQSA